MNWKYCFLCTKESFSYLKIALDLHVYMSDNYLRVIEKQQIRYISWASGWIVNAVYSHGEQRREKVWRIWISFRHVECRILLRHPIIFSPILVIKMLVFKRRLRTQDTYLKSIFKTERSECPVQSGHITLKCYKTLQDHTSKKMCLIHFS